MINMRPLPDGGDPRAGDLLGDAKELRQAIQKGLEMMRHSSKHCSEQQALQQTMKESLNDVTRIYCQAAMLKWGPQLPPEQQQRRWKELQEQQQQLGRRWSEQQQQQRRPPQPQ